MAYTRVSVKKSGNNAGRAKGKAGYILLFDWSQVATHTRDENGVKVATFAFKGTEKPMGVYATDTTQNVYHQSAGPDDARGFIHHADFSHPGDSLAFNEMVENNVNGRLGAIFVPCSGSDCRIAGLPCNPLKMTQDNGQSNTEGTKHDVQLVQSFAGAALGHIDKSLVPSTGDAEIDAELGLPYTEGSVGEGI